MKQICLLTYLICWSTSVYSSSLNIYSLDTATIERSPELYWDGSINGEYLVAQSLIKNGDTVFDVGANFGTYINMLLPQKEHLIIHAFEPVPMVYKFLYQNVMRQCRDHHKTLLVSWFNYINKMDRSEKLHINSSIQPPIVVIQGSTEIMLINGALSNKKKKHYFFFDEKHPSVGGLDDKVIKYYKLNAHDPAHKIMVELDTIDSYCESNHINTIDYIKIDTEGHDFIVILGGSRMINKKNIKYIQFEYTGRCKKAGWNLEKAYCWLKKHDYYIYKIVPTGLLYIDSWNKKLENYHYANYLASSTLL